MELSYGGHCCPLTIYISVSMTHLVVTCMTLYIPYQTMVTENIFSGLHLVRNYANILWDVPLSTRSDV